MIAASVILLVTSLIIATAVVNTSPKVFLEMRDRICKDWEDVKR